MRNMSFALTTTQILARTKTVTRRTGWAFLKAGDFIQAVEKGMGLKKGEKAHKLAVLRVVDVRTERLDAITADDVAREGFPGWTPEQFVEMFCASHSIPDRRQGPPRNRYRPPFPCLPCDEVTRIEFEYVDSDAAVAS